MQELDRNMPTWLCLDIHESVSLPRALNMWQGSTRQSKPLVQILVSEIQEMGWRARGLICSTRPVHDRRVYLVDTDTSFRPYLSTRPEIRVPMFDPTNTLRKMQQIGCQDPAAVCMPRHELHPLQESAPAPYQARIRPWSVESMKG